MYGRPGCSRTPKCIVFNPTKTRGTTGDPIEYCSFEKAFGCLIESKNSSNSAQLYYLVQCTRGEEQELMHSCLAMNPSEGYPEARHLLHNCKGPVLKAEDSKALQKLSTLLTSCKNTLKSIGYSSKIENPDSLRGIVERLSCNLRKRWRSTADKITETEDRQITFDDSVAFIEKENSTMKCRIMSLELSG